MNQVKLNEYDYPRTRNVYLKTQPNILLIRFDSEILPDFVTAENLRRILVNTS